MKKIFLILLVLVVSACKQNKIGYVDTVKIMEDYKERLDIDVRFKAKGEAYTKKRDSITQAFQMEAQAFQVRAQKMSQKKAQEESVLFQQKSQFIGQQLQQEELAIQQSGQVEMDSLVSKVKKEISAYGKANAFTYVFTAGEGGSVLYGADENDLTEAILKLLNDKYSK